MVPIGSQIGVFRIESLLGVGGMGEVYRARDTNLNRDVAIKILPEAFSTDPERLARFKREAQVLASLNHPNIALIHGFEDSGGIHALVLELVEGLTLADRIANGPLPMDEALAIARQIAEALECAHEAGVVHRDLKPANIKVREDGTVKVLDFGLAKLAEPVGIAAGGSAMTQSPTITTPAMTAAGMILGTAAYMSPEQAKGRAADRRSDIWAFGCVLYEMLTGKRAFEGEDISDTLANILKADPDWTAIEKLPRPVVVVLKGCLQRNRALRIADASTLLFVLREPSASTAEAPRPAARRLVMPVATAAMAGILLGAVIAGLVPRSAPRPPAAVTRFVVPLGSERQFTAPGRHLVALSPDGTRLVYAANAQLYMRALNSLDDVPIRGTGGERGTGVAGRNPFFSPDGRWIGFWQDGKLKKVLAEGGAPVDICDAGNPFGATWEADNTIVYGEGPVGIYRVSAEGGTPTLIVRDPGGLAHGPQILPDKRTILFTLKAGNGAWDEAQIIVQSLETGHRDVIVRGTDARFVETGHLVYVANGTLYAAPFDATSLKMTGGSIALVENVAQSPSQTGAAHFAISRTGTLAYVVGRLQQWAPQTFAWVDRKGRETPLTAPPHGYEEPRLSPDNTRIAVRLFEDQRIWLWDVQREALAPLTPRGTRVAYPVWTRDGSRVAYVSSSSGIWWQAADGGGTPQRLAEASGGSQLPTSFAADGRLVITDGEGNFIKLLTPAPNGRMDPLIGGLGMSARNGEVSPDGRLLASETNESGQFQIVVRPFPNVNGGRWQVSTDGGTQPLWSHDGRELFYIAAAGAIMRVQVAEEPSVAFSTPTLLLRGPYSSSALIGAGRKYDVSRQGDQFLVMKPVADAERPRLPDSMIVVQNWFTELQQRVPTR
jgi:serine/threonine-protein kinase